MSGEWGNTEAPQVQGPTDQEGLVDGLGPKVRGETRRDETR